MTKHTRNFAFVACLGLLAGVLIWAKLRLVTDIPRSAFATPDQVEPAQNPHTERAQDQDEDLDQGVIEGDQSDQDLDEPDESNRDAQDRPNP